MPEPTFCQISVRCEEFHDNGNGTITLRFLGRTLSADEHRMIESLVPSRIDAFYKLLQEQTLLDSIASEADMMKPSTKRK